MVLSTRRKCDTFLTFIARGASLVLWHCAHVNYHPSVLVKLLETHSVSSPNLLPTSVIIAWAILDGNVLQDKTAHFEVALLANDDVRCLLAQLGEPASAQLSTSIQW